MLQTSMVYFNFTAKIHNGILYFLNFLLPPILKKKPVCFILSPFQKSSNLTLLPILKSMLYLTSSSEMVYSNGILYLILRTSKVHFTSDSEIMHGKFEIRFLRTSNVYYNSKSKRSIAYSMLKTKAAWYISTCSRYPLRFSHYRHEMVNVT